MPRKRRRKILYERILDGKLVDIRPPVNPSLRKTHVRARTKRGNRFDTWHWAEFLKVYRPYRPVTPKVEIK
jgi:hypothetical protein